MSKSFRRNAASEKHQDERDYRRNRKNPETKSQKKRVAAALKRGDVSDFYDEEDEHT
jgi:hypothetical protein